MSPLTGVKFSIIVSFPLCSLPLVFLQTSIHEHPRGGTFSEARRHEGVKRVGLLSASADYGTTRC
jgi:hypothetical protein